MSDSGLSCLFVVEMIRLGSVKFSGYLVGVYSNREKARKVGEAYKVWRGNNYEYRITPVELDKIDEEVMEHYSQCMTEGCVLGDYGK